MASQGLVFPYTPDPRISWLACYTRFLGSSPRNSRSLHLIWDLESVSRVLGNPCDPASLKPATSRALFVKNRCLLKGRHPGASPDQLWTPWGRIWYVSQAPPPLHHPPAPPPRISLLHKLEEASLSPSGSQSWLLLRITWER